MGTFTRSVMPLGLVLTSQWVLEQLDRPQRFNHDLAWHFIHNDDQRQRCSTLRLCDRWENITQNPRRSLRWSHRLRLLIAATESCFIATLHRWNFATPHTHIAWRITLTALPLLCRVNAALYDLTTLHQWSRAAHFCRAALALESALISPLCRIGLGCYAYRLGGWQLRRWQIELLSLGLLAHLSYQILSSRCQRPPVKRYHGISGIACLGEDLANAPSKSDTRYLRLKAYHPLSPSMPPDLSEAFADALLEAENPFIPEQVEESALHPGVFSPGVLWRPKETP